MKLRQIYDFNHHLLGYAHWCPGCGEHHVFDTEQANPRGARWSFDGNMEAPTFAPSMRVLHQPGEWAYDEATNNDKWVHTGPEVTKCHYNLTKGMLIYHGDCLHELAGQTVPLPDRPPQPGGSIV